MGKIEWGKQFSAGVKDIDCLNKGFIKEINGLIDTIRKEKDLRRIKVLLSDFADHANRHFRLEETYLRDRFNAFEYSDHCERHLFFEDFLRNPLLKNSGENQSDADELGDFLADWIAFHIQHLDKNAFCSQNG